MLKNYITTALRNFLRYKTYTFINILGLSIGIACCILIFLFIQNELSYDKFHKNAERIFRVNSYIVFGGSELDLPVSSDAMGAALKKDYPEVEEFTRIYTFNGTKLLKKGDQFINEHKVAHADSTFFKVFSFEAVDGNLNTALNEPNTVVINESMALKYFGSIDAVGKTILADGEEGTLYKITAVIKDMPLNSHFNFDFIFSMDNVNYGWNNYLSHNFYTYLLLNPGINYKEFEKNFKQYTNQYVIPQASHITSIKSMEEFEKAGNKLAYSLTPLTEIHLHSNRSFELSPGGNIQYVYIFSAVALFILIIACINFMNLTTARSATRAKEVGIRKTLGTDRRNLIWQFLSESTLLALISLVLAYVIADIALPFFNNLSDKSLSLSSLSSKSVLPFLILFPFLIGLIAGSYPAFYLSAFKPVEVLKGKIFSTVKSGNLRSVLVVVQFCTSVIIITATIIIYSQLNFIQNKNLGFQKDQVLIINETGWLGNNDEAFKNEILKIEGVMNGTFSGFLPIPSARNSISISLNPVMNSTNTINMQSWTVDHDYTTTLGIEFIDGRNFSKEFGTDTSAIIINESAASLFGFKDPVGKKLFAIDNMQAGLVREYTIIGLVRNFHFESLRENIGPLSLRLGRNNWMASFRVKAADISNILSKAEQIWKEMVPGIPFSYTFLDDSFNNMYKAELRVGKIALIFSLLAIFIACLGLFGLAAFMAEQRRKEIGIRKVLGADSKDIIILLSRNFLKLVTIAFIIAAPLAFFFMKNWLEDFAYRIEISWWMILSAGALSILIAFITISFQTIKVAASNPVKSIKYE